MSEPLGGHAAGDDLFRDGLFPCGDSFGDGPVGGQQQEYSAIEAIIRAAGDHIEPTDDLRPRTLEAARRRCRQQRIGRRAGGLAVAALLLAMSFFSKEDGTGVYRQKGTFTVILTAIISICLTIIATAKLWFTHLWKKNSTHDRHKRHTANHPVVKERELPKQL